MGYCVAGDLIAKENAKLAHAQDEDFAALGRRLEPSGADIDAINARAAGFAQPRRKRP